MAKTKTKSKVARKSAPKPKKGAARKAAPAKKAAPKKKAASKKKATAPKPPSRYCLGKCVTCSSPCTYDAGHTGSHYCALHAPNA